MQAGWQVVGPRPARHGGRVPGQGCVSACAQLTICAPLRRGGLDHDYYYYYYYSVSKARSAGPNSGHLLETPTMYCGLC